MKFSTDHIFTIGDSHTVCQDYATSGILNCAGKEVAYAIVSDGCSSSPNTDIGSRILCLCMVQTLEECFYNPDHIEPTLKTHVKYAKDPIGITLSNLDATLLCVATDGEIVRTLMWGDGCYAQNQDVYEVNYPTGAPFYLSYTMLNTLRKEAYKKEFGGEVQIIRNDEIICDMDASTHPCVDLTSGVGEGDLFLVASDGVSSYINSDRTEVIPTSEIMGEILAFKNYQGEFVHRRINKMTKQFHKKGWVHYDDVSVAAIYVHKEES